jgi:hypothetical protein
MLNGCALSWEDWWYLTSTYRQYAIGCYHLGLPNGPAGNRGSLVHGDSLINSGYGYFQDPVGDAQNTDDFGCDYYVHQKIVSAGVWWYTTYGMGARLSILDISRQFGGYFFPHGSHQNGLDVDIRYVRTDQQESALDLTVPAQFAIYDKPRSIAIMQRFCDQGASAVYVATIAGISTNDVSCRVIDEEHFNHFHVRFPDPDGTQN